MITPFYKFGYFGDEISLIVAFVIGIGFGFFLERAGFGSSKKLAAQFYFKDLTVFKVMFTAIITAMMGIFYISAIGFLDLAKVYTGNTFIIPQITGGLMLGFGFVIGGYCPGTSVVAMSTGKLDGLIFLLGVFFGVFVFGELYPLISGFHDMTNMGRVIIPDYLHISYGLAILIVVIIALGGFAGAEWVEKRFGYKKNGGKS